MPKARCATLDDTGNLVRIVAEPTTTDTPRISVLGGAPDLGKRLWWSRLREAGPEWQRSATLSIEPPAQAARFLPWWDMAAMRADGIARGVQSPPSAQMEVVLGSLGGAQRERFVLSASGDDWTRPLARWLDAPRREFVQDRMDFMLGEPEAGTRPEALDLIDRLRRHPAVNAVRVGVHELPRPLRLGEGEGLAVVTAGFPLVAGGGTDADALGWFRIGCRQVIEKPMDPILTGVKAAASTDVVRLLSTLGQACGEKGATCWLVECPEGFDQVDGKSWQLAFALAALIACGREPPCGRGRLIASGAIGVGDGTAFPVNHVDKCADKLALLKREASPGDHILLPASWLSSEAVVTHRLQEDFRARGVRVRWLNDLPIH